MKGLVRSMKYDNSFKLEALKLSDEIGVRRAAEQLGIPYYTLADWRNIRKSKGESAFVGAATAGNHSTRKTEGSRNWKTSCAKQNVQMRSLKMLLVFSRKAEGSKSSLPVRVYSFT